jgi:exodeoxyribonuclease VII small subunit
MARPAAPSATAPELTFEGALERLEAIVAKLESGELELEHALAAFEEGVTLSRRCTSQLEEAERRIERLVGGADGTAREPFDLTDEGDAGG